MRIEGATFIDRSFANVQDAMSCFDEQTIDAGPISRGVNGTLNLGWELDVSSTGNESFVMPVIVGNATPNAGILPEPASAILAYFGFSCLAYRRRK